MSRDELAFFVDIPRRYGDVARFRLGPYVWFVVNDPTLVEQVLVHDAAGYTKGLALQRARLLLGDGLITSEDPLHARQRRLAAPAFAPRRIARYGETMTTLAAATASAGHVGAVAMTPRSPSAAGRPPHMRVEARS
jgi:cytochrome P450